MPFDKVRERHKSRGNILPVSWIHSSSSTGQEIKGAIEVIVVPHSGSQKCNMACRIVPEAIGTDKLARRTPAADIWLSRSSRSDVSTQSTAIQ
ncbi:MAG: hypothetical protein WA435_05130 [Gallionellaceae bacterium]